MCQANLVPIGKKPLLTTCPESPDNPIAVGSGQALTRRL
jgi:hypothetical protein